MKLPIWVVVCMPAVTDALSEISTIERTDRLEEFAQMLVDQRPVPEGFTSEIVNLRLAG